jgi:hypothetical protein
MIKISNSTSENKPPWLLGELSEPTRTSLSGAPAGAAQAAAPSDTWTLRARAARALASGVRAMAAAVRILLSCLAAIPCRLGDRLFAMNDAEAYWSDWQMTRTHGGLGRRYRDPRFDTLAECQKCRGAGTTGSQPCPPCLGTGRVTLGQVG